MYPLSDHKNPRVELLAGDARADELLERLLAHIRVGEDLDALVAWRTLVPTLLAHLDTEEMYVLPAFEGEDRVECERLHADHADIRRALGEIGIAFDLHTARAGPIESLRAILSAHSLREDGILYPYAERRLPVATVKALVTHLRTVADDKATVRR
jgi:Hemerythrin HHE cation binding domain